MAPIVSAAALLFLLAGASQASPITEQEPNLVPPSRRLRRPPPPPSSLPAVAPAAEAEARIIGGSEVRDSSSWPYVAGLMYGDWSDGPGCGGVLIAPRVLLTAAHCLGKRRAAWPDRAVVGATEWARPDRSPGGARVRLDPDRASVHPSYDRRWFTNDLAVFGLDGPVGTAYARVNSDPAVPRGGDRVRTAGFGDTTCGNGKWPDRLREVGLNYVPQSSCRRAGYGNGLTADMMCAYNWDSRGEYVWEDACSGDSGGPLVAPDGSLVGLVSWGIDDYNPGVYARVSYNYGWIRDQVCLFSDGDAPAYFGCGPGGGPGAGGGGGGGGGATPTVPGASGGGGLHL